LIVTDASVRKILRHLRSSQDEQGGLLLGEVFTKDESVGVAASGTVVVSQAIPALDFASSGISLRMEAGVWDRARRALGPLELVVGWYHSHPGLGAFFSATDRRTQRAFFPHAYSVGWVSTRCSTTKFFVGGSPWRRANGPCASSGTCDSDVAA
jgi:proteasome lid subunit RPN8/RPN11